MKKLNVKHTLLTIGILSVIIAALVICYRMFFHEEELILNGSHKQVMMLHSIYQEQGTNQNQEDVSIKGEVDTSQAGTYKIEYTFHHQTLKRTVEVRDDRQLVMNLNGSKETYVKQGQKYIESGCHAIDQKEGDLTKQVKISGQVDTSRIGDYEIIYSLKNKQGVECSLKRIVHVVDSHDFVENTKGIPVLMYHYVYTKNDVPQKLNTNYILDTKLEEQLQYLIREHYYFPSYQELSAYIKDEIDLPEKSVVLTFDDGQKGFLKYGIPLLEKYQVPATSFLIASQNGEKKVRNYASPYISFQSHSYDLHKGGGTIGHGGIISALSSSAIQEDLLKAQTIVQNTEAFAYPYGDVTQDAQKAVNEAQILCAFTTQYGKVQKGDDATALPRVRVLGEASLQSYITSLE